MASSLLHESCRVAFKEWSVVCAALAQGRQSLILRKGGIHEGRDGFRVAHDRFWLFPTWYHQAAQCITSESQDLLAAAREQEGAPGQIRIRLFAVVETVAWLKDLATVEKLARQHIWSPETVRGRFQYRSSGLFALFVRIYESSSSVELADESHFAGCRSWVEFRHPLPHTRLRPVLSDAEHAERRRMAQGAWS